MIREVAIVRKAYVDGAECWTVEYSMPYGNVSTTYYDWEKVMLLLMRTMGPDEERWRKIDEDKSRNE